MFVKTAGIVTVRILTHCLIMFYICTKFYEIISKGFRCTDSTVKTTLGWSQMLTTDRMDEGTENRIPILRHARGSRDKNEINPSYQNYLTSHWWNVVSPLRSSRHNSTEKSSNIITSNYDLHSVKHYKMVRPSTLDPAPPPPPPRHTHIPGQ